MLGAHQGRTVHTASIASMMYSTGECSSPTRIAMIRSDRDTKIASDVIL
jgi:hypothetical protein